MSTHSRPRPTARPSRVVLTAAALSAAVIGVLQVLHRHVTEVHPLPPLLHWGRDAALALPVALLAVLVAAVVARRDDLARPRLAAALAGGAVFGVLSVPAGEVHAWLFVAEHTHGSFLEHGATDGMAAWLAASLVLLAVLREPRSPRARSVRRTVSGTVGLALVASTVPGLLTAPAAAAVAPACAVTRTYNVAAINVNIPYNRWDREVTAPDGTKSRERDIDFDGLVYVLQEDKEAVRNWDVPLNHVRGAELGTYVTGVDPANGRRLRPRPLVLRANAGDCVKVSFTNELKQRQFGGLLVNPRASMHVHGASYDVQTSDGSAVGFNEDTTVPIGGSRTYDWVAPEEGLYSFHDHGMPAGSEADGGSGVHGLFGALAVEPAGSAWTDPESGARLDSATPYMDPKTRSQSGDLYIEAIITPPSGKQFRESVQLSQDEIPGIGFGFNYGAEPGDRREQRACPDCIGEETALSSWTYGDPALVKLASGLGPWYPQRAGEAAREQEDCGLAAGCWVANVTSAYRWDATKIRYGHATAYETHVFHMHAHQWLAEPKDVGAATNGEPSDTNRPESTTVDSQTYGPGDMFTADLLWGAGSRPGTVGDSIFHCHLYPHFAEGFWALLRVHDVREDGTGRTPDGIKVRNVLPLSSNTKFVPPAATDENPGFPRFIPGEFGWRAPQPYKGVTQGGQDVTRMVAGRPLSKELATPTQEVSNTAPDPVDEVQTVGNDSAARNDVQTVANDSSPRHEVQLVANDATARNEVQLVHNDSAARNEVQTVTSTATGGTFVLGFDGVTTGPIAFDAPATGTGSVEEALQTAKPGLDVDVTKATTGNTWSVTFVSPAGTDVAELVVDPTGLLDGTATASTTAQGGGGTFTLGFDGATTGPIAFDAPATGPGSVEDALQTAKPGLDVDVTKATTSNTWSVTFLSPARTDVSELVADGALLSSGTASTRTTAQGGGGTFTLTLDGATTAPIAFDAPATGPGSVEDALQTAKAGLDVDVTKSATSNTWSVTFLSPAGTDVSELIADGALLSSGTASTRTTAQGGGGTFTLTLDGATTAPIVFDAPATGPGSVEEALQTATTGLDVDVTKATTGNRWTVTFLSPAGTDVAQLTADGALLSSGTATTTTTVDGGNGGTFTLAFDGATTGPIAFDAPATGLRSVEEALQTAKPGLDVDVTKATTGNTWTVTFLGALGNVAALVGDGAGLTSGTVTTATTAEGVPASSFTLTFDGQTTVELAHDAPATGLGSVEEALQTAKPGLDVDVTKAAAGNTWTVKLLKWPRTATSLAITENDPQTTVSAPVDLSNPDVVRTATALAVERAVMLANNGGVEPKRGAPLTDPCKDAKREITYDVSIIQRDVVYNEGGWHDTQGRMLVLSKDVDAVMAGTKEPEPLFIRVQSGDCINYNLTNRLPNFFGADAFVKLAQTNMMGAHVHLVKFDVLGSDGSSNGWNYQEAAFSEDQAAFNQGVLDGTQTCTTTGVDPCRIPLSAGAGYSPTGAPLENGQTIHARWFADYELRTVFMHDHHFAALDQNRGMYGGLLVEPAGSDFRHPTNGTIFTPSSSTCAVGASCVGDAVGTAMDVILPGAANDFREFGLSFQDFVSLTKPGGNPANAVDVFNPPDAPENFPQHDPGVMAINYRNAPFLLRDTKNGNHVDPAYRLSSTVFGDPKTPLLRAYAGDRVRTRLIGGSQEEQHVFNLHGMRWRDEPDDPQSPLVNVKAMGISDAFNFEVPRMECGADDDCRGDYLYSSNFLDDIYLGMWGLMRVYGKGVDGLLPLPDNVPQAVNGNTSFPVTGEAPPKANKPGTPCAGTDPVKTFHVLATDGKITYNKHGDHDPYGLMYGLVDTERGETIEEAVARTRANPQPLVLRANEGDCLEVTLTNKIDPAGAYATQHINGGDGDTNLPLEPPIGTRGGLRVSLHPQVLKYDVRGSDGATVGFNRDQTVGPDESILYRWSANDEVFGVNTPGEIGATNLTDYGDLRGHRHHGLFAGLIIEPKGASYYDPYSGQEISSGVQADIRVPGQPDFREMVPFFSDGLNLRDKAGALIKPVEHDAVHGGEPLDSEDQGEKAFGYGSEPFRHRLPGGQDPVAATTTNPLDGAAMANVYSSKAHGDPSTPVFRAYAGDPVRMRVLQGADKPRQHLFVHSGHAWKAQPDDPGSTLLGGQGGMSVGRGLNLHFPSAGGPGAVAGDYMYNCGVGLFHLSGGLWGITRVYPKPTESPGFQPTPVPAVDDPRAAGNTPLHPLERSAVTAEVWDDTNQNRTKENGERVLPGLTVKLTQRAPGADGQLYTADDVVTVLDDRARTGKDGKATYSVAPTTANGDGVYDLEPVIPADWADTTGSSVRVDASVPNTETGAVFGHVQLGDVTVRTYNDKDGDQQPGSTEKPLGGWTVTLTGGGQTRTGTTNDVAASPELGFVKFDGLRPGSYTAEATPPPGWYNTRPMPVQVEVAENASLSATDGTDVRLGYALKSGLSVKLFNDSNKDGAQTAGESNLAGWQVTAVGGPQGVTVTAKGTTDANGAVTLDDPDPLITGLRPGKYTITRVPANADWTFVGGTATTTTADGTTAATPGFGCDTATGACTTLLVDDTTQVVTMGNHNPNVWVVAAPFNDVNVDGKRQDKESKLAGDPWQASLFLVDTQAGTRTAVTPTGGTSNTLHVPANGLAVFYPLPALTDPAKKYEVEMLAPPRSPDPAVLDWTATSPTTVRTSPIPGETGRTPHGFAQLGTIGATVFADNDRDGVYDDQYADPSFNELGLANRTVQLWDKTGKTLLAKAVTDIGGHAAFKVSAGAEYQVEVVLPSGYTQTTPLSSSGSPAPKVKMTGPASTGSDKVQWGHYAQADSAPPPPPTATPAGGTYATAQSVTLASETGATIRYTLDGSNPSASHGQPYAGAITISTTTTLKAAATDLAGNVSTVTTESYTISSGSTTAPEAAASDWVISKGTLASGSAADLGSNDSSYLVQKSAKSGNKQVTDGYGRYVVPTEQRNMSALTTEYDGGANTASTNVSRTLSLYDFATGAWEVLGTDTQPNTDKTSVHQPGGDVKRFLSPTGEIRYRVQLTDGKAFDMKADKLTFTISYQ